jgi:hypothetical protein
VGCLILAGAVAGAAAAGTEYGVDVAQGEKEFSAGELGKEMAVGGVIGGLTAGAGVAGGKVMRAAGKNLRRGDDLAEEFAEDGAAAARRGGGCAVPPPPVHSFAPTTAVLMADGSTEAIADIEPGDQVLATDPVTGETETRTVTVRHSNQDTELTDVDIVGADGRIQTLETTWHPLLGRH